MIAKSFARRAFALAAVLLITACSSDLGADRLKGLDDGDTRDKVLSTMGSGPKTAVGTDSLRIASGFRRQMFTANGKQFEIVWYSEEGSSLEAAITRKTDTPVVLSEGKLLGWGWSFYDDFTAEQKLPNAAPKA